MADGKPKAKLPDPVAVDAKPRTCQPTKAEMEEEFDMPGWSLDQVRDTFTLPFVAKDS